MLHRNAQKQKHNGGYGARHKRMEFRARTLVSEGAALLNGSAQTPASLNGSNHVQQDERSDESSRARLACDEDHARNKEAEEQERLRVEEQTLKEAEEQARKEAEEQERLRVEEQTLKEAEEQARKEAEEQARKEAEEQTLKEAEEQARKEAEEQARKEAEEQRLKEAEEQARKEAIRSKSTQGG
jgi:membrane protein involved in colicin uptake